MRTILATAMLLAGMSAGFAQTLNDTCGDVISNPNASCPSVMAPSAGGSYNSGSTTTSSGSGIVDSQTTGSIQLPTVDEGFGVTNPGISPDTAVSNDPLGQNVGQNPYGGGNQIGIPSLGTNGAIGSRGGGIVSQPIR